MDTILIVDDVAANLTFLFEILEAENYKVLYAKNGLAALKRAALGQPDLILLDVMMPDIDGFETCKRLKKQAETQDIPVIFMTALDEVDDKVRGFSLGAVDYVTKPINSAELIARLQTHLRLYHLQKQLNDNNQNLENFASTVAHDLKNPLTGIQSMLSMMPCHPETHLHGEDAAYLGLIHQETDRAIEIIDSLLLLASSDSQNLAFETINMTQSVGKIITHLQYLIERYQGKVEIKTPLPHIYSYQPWVLTILENYISNALKYAGEPPQIRISAKQQQQHWRFCIQDNGEALSLEQQQLLFKPFSRLYNKKNIEGHGLGLSIVKAITHKLGGDAGVESHMETGNCFYFSLPALPGESWRV